MPMTNFMKQRFAAKTPAENVAMIARIARSQADLINARTGDKYAETIKAFRDQADLMDFVGEQLENAVE